jgi:hypothetical protein
MRVEPEHTRHLVPSPDKSAYRNVAPGLIPPLRCSIYHKNRAYRERDSFHCKEGNSKLATRSRYAFA